MAERSVIQIDFSGGTDERTDARHVVPGKLTSLKNGVFEKGGSIRKRRGYTALSRLTFAGATLAAARELTTFRDELLLDDGSSVYGLGAKWTPRGELVRAFVSRDPIYYSENNLGTPSVAYANGYLIYAWCSRVVFNRGAALVTVVDVANGSEVFSAFVLGPAPQAESVRVAVLANKAYVFWAEGPTKIIRASSLDLTAISGSAWSAPVTIISDTMVGTHVFFDVCALSDRIAVAYGNDGLGGNTITVKTFNAALTQLATRTIAAYAAVPNTIGICGVTGERVWVTYGDAVGSTLTLKVTTLNDATLAELVTYTVASTASVSSGKAAICRVDSTHALVCWYAFSSATNGILIERYALLDTTITAVGSGLLWRHAHISKPFMVGSKCYLMVAHLGDAWFAGNATANPTQGSLVELPLASVTGQLPVEAARVAPNRVCFSSSLETLFSDVASIGGGKYVALARIKGGTALGLDAVKFSFSEKSFARAEELGEALHFAAGLPLVYDGAGLVESAIGLPANKPYDVQQSTGTGGITNGTYFYVLVYVRHDENGQVYRSEPSIPVQVTVSGATPTANKVTFRAPCLPLQRAGSTSFSSARDVYIKVYRTLNGGSTLLELPTFGITPEPVINDPSTDFISITDSTADTDLSTRPVLYTTGGVLANTMAPSASLQTVHKERLWLAGTDEPKVVWFSKHHVFGEGVGVNPLLTLEVDDGGAVTALASLDSHLIIFKRDRIFYVDGDGPPDTGGEGFSTPQRISADLGCIEPRSVVLTPEGLLFQSPAGIYVLDRGLGLAYVSGPVEDKLSAYPVITSAVVHESQFHVRFSCTTTDGTSGVVLVFDYLVKEWSVFEIAETVAAVPRAAIVAACNRAGAYTWVAGNGAAYAESSTSYTDAGTWVTLSLETSWLKVGGLQGWQRAWSISLLGERFTPHDLVIEAANDYAPAYHQTKTWTDVAIATMPLEQIRTALTRQKCQALRFRISDATPTGGGAVGTGRGLSFTGIAIEAAVLRKTKRLGAAQRG